jgi:hypothetical protein
MEPLEELAMIKVCEWRSCGVMKQDFDGKYWFCIRGEHGLRKPRHKENSREKREEGLLRIRSIAIAGLIDPDWAIARRTDRLGVTPSPTKLLAHSADKMTKERNPSHSRAID